MDKDIACTLMHKHIPVAEMELDEATGFVRKIGAVYASEHLPVGVAYKNGIIDRRMMNDWWTERSIPASRSGVREVLEKLEITDTRMLLVRCYGLSLSDQYWIRPAGRALQWSDINFFQNNFSEDIGDVLFRADKNDNELDFSSQDSTSDGNLKKRWKIIDGKRCLVKGGSNPFRLQPFNEVIATGIMERLDIPHVPYRLIWNHGAPYSVCEDFVDENTELIPAWRILGIRKKNNSKSMYQHFVDCCAALGIRDVVPFLDRMITLDYILANEDRHFNNFGALRNAETLEWIGMAPIYDSGSSLGYDKMPVQMRSEKEVVCKPFKNHHIEQLKLVTSFDWLDLSRLSDVGEFITDVFSDENAADYMDLRRITAIRDSVQRRIGNLTGIVSAFHGQGEITAEDDVKENIAAEYDQNCGKK
ncbi:MAG: HipA domain-containing protein [Lachnospiraceae bacterium]|nr:HipA domain-containing protein [Lachnospiraceae bacterium]